MTNLVGLHLARTGHLADALDRAARELDGHAKEGLLVAHGVGLTAGPAGRVDLVAAWAHGEARALRAMVRRLQQLDGGPVRWSGPAFADPVAAYQWGRWVVAALEAGDLATAGRLLAEHRGDPVLATVVLQGLPVDHLLQLLRVGEADWPEARAVVLGLADVLATATRAGTTSLDLRSLADRADEVDLPRSALGLLFAGDVRFPTELLRQAVEVVVTPLNALALAGHALPWLAGGLDTRVLVLDAAGRDPQASRQAVGSVDLDELLPGATSYTDGGVALARVLLHATEHPVNAQRVIEWVGRHRTVPLAVHAELGRLAAPWIGSFRAPGLDDVVLRDLPLDEDAARAYLTYACARDRAAADLDDAAWRWADRTLDRLADGDVGFDAVGSVLGTVTLARLDADALRAVDLDRRTTRRNALWRRATSLALGRLPAPARRLASPIVGRVLNRVLPAADDELRHWRDLRDPAVLHEHLALDYLAALTLWARGGLDPPPSQLLLDPQRPELGLRNPLDLDAADAERWVRWRAANGPGPLQALGDRFLADSRR